jgi:hypothetical protein
VKVGRILVHRARFATRSKLRAAIRADGFGFSDLTGEGQRRAFTPAVILFIALPEAEDNAGDLITLARAKSINPKGHEARRPAPASHVTFT